MRRTFIWGIHDVKTSRPWLHGFSMINAEVHTSSYDMLNRSYISTFPDFTVPVSFVVPAFVGVLSLIIDCGVRSRLGDEASRVSSVGHEDLHVGLKLYKTSLRYVHNITQVQISTH